MAELTCTYTGRWPAMSSAPQHFGLADGSEYDVGGEWVQIGLFDAVSAALGEQITPAAHRTQLIRPRRASGA
jgi:lysyl-tRNA synthetase, class II